METLKKIIILTWFFGSLISFLVFHQYFLLIFGQFFLIFGLIGYFSAGGFKDNLVCFIPIIVGFVCFVVGLFMYRIFGIGFEDIYQFVDKLFRKMEYEGDWTIALKRCAACIIYLIVIICIIIDIIKYSKRKKKKEKRIIKPEDMLEVRVILYFALIMLGSAILLV